MILAAGMASGLQRRLLALLLLPLLLLALLNAWFALSSADSAALQQDRQLLSLVPLLADSVVQAGAQEGASPVLLMAPAIETFLGERPDASAFSIVGNSGEVLAGSPWLGGSVPTTRDAEFSSEEFEGTTYRIVSQRMPTAAGELTLRLADGSDPRQQWLRQLWLKVVVPNLVLAVVGFFAVNWAVRRALRPLIALKEAVERRSPRDLSAIDESSSPDEVRPLVSALNRLLGLVEAQADSQRRFVADAAHQLRTPLAGLQAQVEAWAQAVSTDRYKQKDVPAHTQRAQAAITLGADQIARLREATRRTSQLANQLLALSRVDARSTDGTPMQRVDLAQLCEVVLEARLDAAAAKDIDLGLDTQAIHAYGHAWLLREMLSNLVDNAVRYTPVKGRVTLRCGRQSDSQRPFLEVEDNGVGIPEGERERVLQRFYRMPGTGGEGTGLGLAIADEIARMHHGTLQLSTGSDGRGLRVTLALPQSPSIV